MSPAGAAEAEQPESPVRALEDSPPPEPDAGRRGSGRGLRVLVGVLLVVALVASAIQTRRAVRLSERVEVLTGELAGAREELRAYRGHLDQVRGSVAELRERFRALDALVARDPGGDPAP